MVGDSYKAFSCSFLFNNNRPGQNVARLNFHINQRAKQHSFSDPFSLHVLLCALISKIATREQIAIKEI